MVLKQSFADALEQAEDEFEIIATCYCELLSYKNDTDVVFASRVGNIARDDQYRQYASEFENLRQRIISYSQKVNLSGECAGTGFKKFQESLKIELEKFQCPDNLDKAECVSICMLYVLEALDSYLEKNIEFIIHDLRSFGPLNKGASREKCSVYLQEHKSFLSTAYDGLEGFRKPQGQTRIGSMFQMFLLVLHEEQFPAPQIVPLFLNEDCREKINQDQYVRIVSIPYIGFDTFWFQERDSSEPCEFDTMPRGPFYVKYIEEEEADNVARVVKLLDLAIRREANIIIFPEFIMSKGMQNSVKDYLQNLERNKKKQLSLVLAGTCYDWNCQNKTGNNILHMFNANGIEIGCYYKYSPFLIREEEWYHGASLTKEKQKGESSNQRRFIRNCEVLSEPGKKCTIVDIEVIGRVLPAICRDVIDGEITSYLTKKFMPSILMVPAWSKSVESFDAPLSALGETVHTVSLLCNCCNAVKNSGTKPIGKIFVPQKVETKMVSRPTEIRRSKSCFSECRRRGGCVVQIDIDFSQKKATVDTNKHFL